MYLEKKTSRHTSELHLLLCAVMAICLGLPQGLAKGIQTAGRLQLPAVVVATTQGQPSRASADDASKGTVQAQHLPEGTSGDWWNAVQADIHQSEYQVSWQDRSTMLGLGAGYQAPNRAQGWRTYFTPEGIWVLSRTQTTPYWKWGLRLREWGFAEALEPVEEANLVVEANRVEYQRGALTEWYLNDENGLEQGFTLSSPPQSGRESNSTWIVLKIALIGDLSADIDSVGETIDFTTKGGVRVLRYSQLMAFDFAGKALPAKFNLADEGIEILVNTGKAVYPITIDPLASTPTWTAEGDQEGASFGYSVGTAGDVNGDGYADVIIGANYYGNEEINEGKVFVYHGGPIGLTTSAVWTAEGGQANANFGYSVGTAGDVNGDGYADVIIGAPNYDNEENYAGRAAVYLGSPAGLGDQPAWTMEGDQKEAYFGWSVGTAGDVNGDGYTDVIVGAFGYTNGQTYEGRVYVYHGGKSGLSANPAWTAEGEQAGAFFGYSVGTAGDVNGDGYADIIIGAPHYGEDDEGRASVYHGGASGLSDSPVWTAEGEQAGAHFGYSVSTAGDYSGNGFADVIVGAPDFDHDQEQNNRGRIYIYLGGSPGLRKSYNVSRTGQSADSRFGYSVGTAGDVNGDGCGDVIIGAPGEGDDDEGLIFVDFGCFISSRVDWTKDGDQGFAHFGSSVSAAGDVNGDGYADIIVGAPDYNHGEDDEGMAFTFQGSALGLNAMPEREIEGDQDKAGLGYSVGTAGDVNGDGYSDVIVGAPFYDAGDAFEGRVYVYHGSNEGLSTNPDWVIEGDKANAYLGHSVDTAGDVNGDGYADVIVGATHDQPGESSAGRAYVYHGGESGLDISPAWSVVGEQPNAFLGSSVATAGDVNGDGYADVIVGARSFDNGEEREGVAFVYHGSPSGLEAGPSWAGESDQENAAYGYSVGTAGDVNGDGYADVIVGAPGYDTSEQGEGRAYVYHGSASGLDAKAEWIAEGGKVFENFGYSVGTAGDVNGDGFADVIVGAPFYTEGKNFEGQVYVYHGSVLGLDISPKWTGYGGQALTYFGLSVSTAGDVNGDGYADVIIGGDYSEGNEDRLVKVYLGSELGLDDNIGWMAEFTGANLGYFVATAGDVNGDSYADVIIGEHYYLKDHAINSRAYVYYGNDGGGRLVLARQVQPDGASVQPWGLSESADSFQVHMLASHPMGRGWVKLQVQACPPGESFNSTACLTHTAAEWTDTTTAADGVTLIENVSGLQADTLYRWRARLLYAPQTVTEPGITPPHNPAHGPWRLYLGGSQQADLRTSLNLVPVLTKLDPASSTAGGSDFTLMVEGENFIADVSTVRWDGADRPTTFVSSTELKAEISESDIATEGSVEVTVYNSGLGGGESNTLIFTILPERPVSGDREIYLPIVEH